MSTAANGKQVRKKSAERRSEIVSTVLALSYEIGPDQITAETIAKRLGFTQGALFRHFTTMQDLWEAVIQEIRARLEVAWAPAIETTPLSTPDKLEKIVTRHLGVVQDNPGMAAIIASRELHVRNEHLRNFFIAAGDLFLQRLQAILQEGKQAGDVRPMVDSADSSLFIITMMQGLAIYWSLTNRRFDLPERGRHQFRILWAGLGTELDQPMLKPDTPAEW